MKDHMSLADYYNYYYLFFLINNMPLVKTEAMIEEINK